MRETFFLLGHGIPTFLLYLTCIVFFNTWGQCSKTWWSSMILEMTETIILLAHVIRSRKICSWCWGDLIATGCLCQTDVGCACLRVHFVPSFTDRKSVGCGFRLEILHFAIFHPNQFPFENITSNFDSFLRCHHTFTLFSYGNLWSFSSFERMLCTKQNVDR